MYNRFDHQMLYMVGQPLNELPGLFSLRTDEFINVHHQFAQLGGGGTFFFFSQTYYTMSAYLMYICLWIHF